jgi:ABC-type branched-subunit amino acid transport system substrate-binding protein
MSGRVDADDVSAVQAAVNSGTGPIRMDVNGDRALSQADVAIVQANFGRRGE